MPGAIWLIIQLDQDILPTNILSKLGGNWIGCFKLESGNHSRAARLQHQHLPLHPHGYSH